MRAKRIIELLVGASVLLALLAPRMGWAQTPVLPGTLGTPAAPGQQAPFYPFLIDSSGYLYVDVGAGTITANSSATAASSLPTLSAGAGKSLYESLGAGLYVQPVFASASGGGTQVDATHGLPINIVAGSVANTGFNALQGGSANAVGNPFYVNPGTGASFAVTNAALTAATHAQCAALCANLVAKNAAGTLFSFNVSADSTLSGAAWWIMIYDATSAPSDGSVTPAKCYAMPLGATSFNGAFDTGGETFATGITIGVSTNGCFTKAASTHAFIAAGYQ